MARRPPKFPFPPLPLGEVTPRPGSGDPQQLLVRDLAIVRWFIKERWRRPLKADSTLGNLLALSDAVDMNGPSKTIEEMETEDARHGLHLTAQLTRLAWAIRALHGGADACYRVDASFIDDDLLDDDTKQPDAIRKLPGGIGTLVFAGRLVQAGRGQIAIGGNQSRGHDIRWRTAALDTVLVERKDRSYEAGLSDTQEKRAKRVVDEVRKAHIPREPGAARVLVIGFQHLVRKSEVEAIDRSYNTALERAFGGESNPGLPHLVVVEHLGLEPKTGGEKSNFFSPQFVSPIREQKLVARVGRLIARAIGAPGF